MRNSGISLAVTLSNLNFLMAGLHAMKSFGKN